MRDQRGYPAGAPAERVDPRLAMEWGLAAGFGLLLAVAAVLSELPATYRSTAGLVTFACILAVLGWWARPLGLLATAGCAWLMLNGFLVDRLGELRWHGAVDAGRLGVLVGAAAVGASLGGVRVAGRRPRGGIDSGRDGPDGPDARPSAAGDGGDAGATAATLPASLALQARPGFFVNILIQRERPTDA